MSGNEQADFDAIALRARQMQGEMPAIQSGLKALQATGVSRNGLVTAMVSGEGRLVRLEIDSSVIDPRDPQTLAELVITAVDGAHDALSLQVRERMAQVAGGLQDMLAHLRQRPAEADPATPRSGSGRQAKSTRARAPRSNGKAKGVTGT